MEGKKITAALSSHPLVSALWLHLTPSAPGAVQRKRCYAHRVSRAFYGLVLTWPMFIGLKGCVDPTHLKIKGMKSIIGKARNQPVMGPCV